MEYDSDLKIVSDVPEKNEGYAYFNMVCNKRFLYETNFGQINHLFEHLICLKFTEEMLKITDVGFDQINALTRPMTVSYMYRFDSDKPESKKMKTIILDLFRKMLKDLSSYIGKNDIERELSRVYNEVKCNPRTAIDADMLSVQVFMPRDKSKIKVDMFDVSKMYDSISGFVYDGEKFCDISDELTKCLGKRSEKSEKGEGEEPFKIFSPGFMPSRKILSNDRQSGLTERGGIAMPLMKKYCFLTITCILKCDMPGDISLDRSTIIDDKIILTAMVSGTLNPMITSEDLKQIDKLCDDYEDIVETLASDVENIMFGQENMYILPDDTDKKVMEALVIGDTELPLKIVGKELPNIRKEIKNHLIAYMIE